MSISTIVMGFLKFHKPTKPYYTFNGWFNLFVKNHKNCHLLAFLSFLIAREVFEEVQLGFLVVGDTHET
jgi:hypothetical protein